MTCKTWAAAACRWCPADHIEIGTGRHRLSVGTIDRSLSVLYLAEARVIGPPDFGSPPQSVGPERRVTTLLRRSDLISLGDFVAVRFLSP
jgi:hypothetical protein